jgi:exodeoxyribonuclease V alpha subunit
MGTVTEINKQSNTLKVDLDGRTVIYKADQLDQLGLAYAVTVHKSQGSEFEAVILVLPEGTDRLSYRSLLYTAVTRAKKLLIVIGSPRKVAEMVSNQQKTLRYSCLDAMLREMVAKPQSAEESAS